jgi:hypothetical protein
MDATVFDFMYRSSHFTMSSGETRRFDRSMYPVKGCMMYVMFGEKDRQTFLLVHSQNNDNLVSPDTNQLLD